MSNLPIVLRVLRHKMRYVFVGANFRSHVFQVCQTTRRRSVQSVRYVFLPFCATVNTSNLSTVLTTPPLLKTIFMEVLTASSFTPNDVFPRLHVKDTNRALAINGLAIPGVHGLVIRVVMLMLEVVGVSDVLRRECLRSSDYIRRQTIGIYKALGAYIKLWRTCNRCVGKNGLEFAR